MSNQGITQRVINQLNVAEYVDGSWKVIASLEDARFIDGAWDRRSVSVMWVDDDYITAYIHACETLDLKLKDRDNDLFSVGASENEQPAFNPICNCPETQ